ncbi:hypothetical protein D3C86_1031850 [compost metagenome]
MTRINAIVEGQTEETFVRDVLSHHLAFSGKYVVARCVESSRSHGRIFRGGLLDFPRTLRDINRWLAEDTAAYVTTMFDFFRLPTDFPGMAKISNIQDPYVKVSILEQELAAAVNNPRFIPYIQLHEFETLLFSDVNIIDLVMSEFSTARSQITSLNAIANSYRNPELINSSPQGAPSKRLGALYPGYNKVVFGFHISDLIGLPSIRGSCQHFSNWVTCLEAL